VIKELKDAVEDVKDVLIVAAGRIQELESAERFRNRSRANQPVSPDRHLGYPGSAAPPGAESHSILTLHGQLPVTSGLYLNGRPNTQESGA